MKPPVVLLLPGLHNSGPQHWQTLWQPQIANCERVEQRDFDHAVCSEWVETIEAAVQRHHGNVFLVGHSCGTTVIPHWAARYPRRIAGAMLVAPSDTEMEGFPPEAEGFAPIPLAPLPFPATVVASSNDFYCRIRRAKFLANAWNAKLVEIGPHGHINTDAGFGPWPGGLEMLQKLLQAASIEPKID